MSAFEFFTILLLFTIIVLLGLNFWMLSKPKNIQENKNEEKNRNYNNSENKSEGFPKMKSSTGNDEDVDVEVIDLRSRSRRNSGSSTSSFNRYSSASSFRGHPRGDTNDPFGGSTYSHPPIVTTVYDPLHHPSHPMWQMQNFRNNHRPGEDSINRLARALRPNDNAVEDVIDLVSAVLPPAIRLVSGIIRRAEEENRRNTT